MSPISPGPEPFMYSPKACVSCQQYQHQGFDEDKHCPFQQRSSLQHKPSRTPYGRCGRHGVQVFATQICNAHSPDPHIECFDVSNRPEPRETIQEGFEKLMDGEISHNTYHQRQLIGQRAAEVQQ